MKKILALALALLASPAFAENRPELVPSLNTDVVAQCHVPVQPGIVPQPFTFTVSKSQFSVFVADQAFHIAIETISDLTAIADEIPADVLPEMPCSNESVRLGYYLNANMVRVELLNVDGTVASSSLYQLSNTVQINVN